MLKRKKGISPIIRGWPPHLFLTWCPIIGLIPFFLLGGCNGKRITVADTFPIGSVASPWELRDVVWSGTFEQAASGLGEEARPWSAFEPQHVWLAVYQHDTHADHQLTVRAFAFSSSKQAQRAFEHFRSAGANGLEAGDQGCWTRDGVLVLWGRMVFDIFGSGPSTFASPEQAVYLLAFIEKRMPKDLPGASR